MRSVLPSPEDKLNQVEEAQRAVDPADTARRTRVAWKPDLLAGVNVIEAPGIVDGGSTRLRLISVYARPNRAPDNRWMMLVPGPR